MVQLVLGGRADHSTDENFLKVTQIAQQIHTAAHISHGSWHVLVGVPKKCYQEVAKAFMAIGYKCYIFSSERNDLSTLVLSKKSRETA
jgi:hypothetical protein